MSEIWRDIAVVSLLSLATIINSINIVRHAAKIAELQKRVAALESQTPSH